MCSQYKVSPPKRRLKSLSLPISSPVVTCGANFALRGSVASSIYLTKAFKATKSQSSCLTLNCFRDVVCFITKEPDMLRLNLTSYLLYVTPMSLLPLTFVWLCSVLAFKSSIIQAKARKNVRYHAIYYKCAANLASTITPSIVLLPKQKEGVLPLKTPLI
jgi:hypothetical protein